MKQRVCYVSIRKDCKMALLQMSSVEEAAEALIVRRRYYSFFDLNKEFTQSKHVCFRGMVIVSFGQRGQIKNINFVPVLRFS